MANRRAFAVIDSETDPFKRNRIPEPFAWGFFDGTTFRYWWGDESTEALVDFVRDRPLDLYAHNGGRFDAFYLLDHINLGSRLTIINTRISEMRVGRARVLDSYNLLPFALAQYQKTEIDYAKFERNRRNRHKAEIVDYLRDDCVYLYELLQRFFNEFPKTLTLAGCAAKMWERISGEKMPESNEGYFDTFRAYYHGGRVDAIQPGVREGRFTIVDINSAYPYAMTHDHPYGTDYVVEDDATLESLEGPELVTVTGHSRRALPVKADNGRVEYPDAHGTYNVTGWEVLAGVDTGLLEVDELPIVHRFDYCRSFRQYVDTFFAMKRQAESDNDKGRRQFAKIFLNSLYGKFGADPRNYSEYMLDDSAFEKRFELEGVGWEPWDYVASNAERMIYERELPDRGMRFYNVATAASITGFVRAYLLRAMAQAGGVLYVDTDSMICTTPGKVKLGGDLGAWAVEVRANKVAIGGRKLYAAFQNGHPVKSASKGARLSPEEILQLCAGDTIMWESDIPTFSLVKPAKFISRRIRATT